MIKNRTKPRQRLTKIPHQDQEQNQDQEETHDKEDPKQETSKTGDIFVL